MRSVSSDSKKIVSCAEDRTIKIWDNQNNSCLRTIRDESVHFIQVLFLLSNEQVCSTNSKGILQLWNGESGQCLNFLHPHEKVNLLCHLADNKTLVLSSPWGGAFRWDGKGDTLDKLPHGEGQLYGISPSGTKLIRFLGPSGNFQVYSLGDPVSLQLHDQKLLALLVLRHIIKKTKNGACFKISPYFHELLMNTLPESITKCFTFKEIKSNYAIKLSSNYE